MPMTEDDVARRTEALRLARVDSLIEGLRAPADDEAVLDTWARGEIDADEARRRLRANLETDEKKSAVEAA